MTTCEKCSAEACSTLDGFMSSVLKVDLILGDKNRSEKLHKIFVKIMKGGKNFRDATRSTVQCSNEIYIYKHVIPYLQKFVAECGAECVKTDWVARVYFADYKIFPDISEEEETILALENITPQGYRLGPRIDLDEKHLKLMIKHIASYHAVQYAMRVKGDHNLAKLASGLELLSFIDKNGNALESYKVLFKYGLERSFNIIKNDKKYRENDFFRGTIENFKTKTFENPNVVMQQMLQTDDVFSIILHGDYNKNNVLFKYEEDLGHENPTTATMIDFQEVRYASPIVDLAFFMYTNLHESLRSNIWNQLLELYHETAMKTLAELQKCEANDPRLQPYSFENLIKHSKKMFFYDVMIAVYFIPWMACSENECSRISQLFESDMKSNKLRELLQVSGGDEVNQRIIGVVKHAYDMGYLDIFA